ncbi:MAG: nitroreductase family protein [Defluviitaleaceae bacterium]|nr:nitroreductase family protein [Defluviitaleaceae bacterium]
MHQQTEHDKNTAAQVRLAARHFAMLYFNFCKVMVDTHGEEKALELVQKAIFNLSLDRTDRTRAKALEAGVETNLEQFSVFNDLPIIGWRAWDESMGGLRCPYAEQWVDYYDKHPWFKPFASLYCDVIDTTNIENFSRTLSLKIPQKQLSGDAECKFNYFESDQIKQGIYTYGEREEVLSEAEQKKRENAKIRGMFQLSNEEFLALDEVEFKARFRERLHHTLEIQVYAAAYRGGKLQPAQTATGNNLCELWKQRGLKEDEHEYIYAKKLIELAEKLIAGESVDLVPYAPVPVTAEECESFFRIIYQRRSVREFTKQRVSDELIDRILDSGLWAAHSCNLQSIRYLIIREDDTPGLFVGSDVPGGPVHLVVCQDERVYKANPFNPVRNRLLDAGAAAQNIVLATHAAGLEGVWLTFNEPMLKRLRAHFNLPDYISIVTYVDIGYGDQTPYPVLRPHVKDMILGRC